MSPLLYHWLNFGFSGATVIALATLTFMVIKRNMRSIFPIFFAYIACSMVIGAALSIGYISPRVSLGQYFYAYSALNVLFMLLEFGVMYELVVVALKPYGAIIDLGKMLFRWAGLFLLLAAALTAYATAGSLTDQCSAGADMLARSLRLMQVGLLFLFFLFERRLSLSWRSLPVSIALGMGIAASFELIGSYLSGHYVTWTRWLNLTENASYLVAVIYWTSCFLAPAHKKTNVLDSPSRLIFQRWNEALSTYGYGGSPSTVESFLPGIEKTVDRVMARRVS